MSEYEQYQQIIDQQLLQYAKEDNQPSAKKKLYKALNANIDNYKLYLEEQSASYQRHEWLNERKKKMHQIKMNQEVNKGPTLNKENVKILQEDIANDLNGTLKAVQQCKSVAQIIEQQLNNQIQLLDKMYQENVKGTNRLERAKKGLLTIIRNAMLNKLTRFIAILLVLAVIALIVLYILKKVGILVI